MSDLIIHLLPSQRSALKQMANRELRDMVSQARFLILRGLAAEIKSHPQSAEETCQTCVSCLFWDEWLGDPTSETANGGFCRRYAPYPKVGDEEPHDAMWAVTYEGEWCGEYKPTDKHHTPPEIHS